MYKDAVDYLYSLQRYGIKLGLSNTLSLLDILGNPHQKFKSIHIAGTNGKGSTASMIASILQESGLKVGLYTSPHLVSFTERIRINEVTISEERVAEMTLNLKFQISNFKSLFPTFFEFTTALAFQYFAEEDVDIAVVEVGMGGRLDATNVIRPIVTVITEIGYDHQEFLGNTITQIAGEKAGIIKERVPVIAANNTDEIMEVIRKKAEESGSSLYISGKDFRVKERLQTQESRLKSQVFDYYGIEKSFEYLELHLLGHHQIVNSSLALAAMEVINDEINIKEGDIRSGINSARWEGRLEVISENPTVILDGAHNVSAALALKKAMEEVFLRGHGRLFLIIGMMKDKDINGFLKVLAPLAWEVVVTKPEYDRAAETSLLYEDALRYSKRIKAVEKVSDALDYVENKANIRDIICVTGSLYTIGEIKGIGNGLERLRV